MGTQPRRAPASARASSAPKFDPEADDFVSGGQEITIPEMWNAGENGKKIQEGDAVIGALTSIRVVKHPQYGDMRLAILSPAVSRLGNAYQEYDTLSVVLTKFLNTRVEGAGHVLGKIIAFVYRGNVEAGKGKSDMKTYHVAVVSRERLQAARATAAEQAGVDAPDDSDLPF